MMSKGTSVPSSEAPTSSHSPVVSSPSAAVTPQPRAPVLAAGETKKSNLEDSEGWRKPSKVARHSVKGKDPVVSCDSAGSSGPLALVPALMEVVQAAEESEDRAMADREAQALKRARSPSPDQPGNDRQLVVRPVVNQNLGRRSKLTVRDPPLLLLPAPPSLVEEVSATEPCMLAPSGEPCGELGLSVPAEGGVLVNIPVKEGVPSSGGSRRGSGSRGKTKGGQKAGSRVVKGEGQGKEGVGSGGPIRREKPKRVGVLSRGDGPVRDGKKTVGGEECGGSEASLGKLVGATGGSGAKKSRKHGMACCGGPGSLEDVDRGAGGRTATDAVELGHSPQQASASGSGASSSGCVRGEVSGLAVVDGARSLGKSEADGVVAASMSRGQSPCSPGRLLGSLLGGRTSPGGKKEGADRRGHGALVKKILGAVQKAGASREAGRKEEDGGEEEEGGRVSDQ